MTRNGCTRERWEQKQFEPNRKHGEYTGLYLLHALLCSIPFKYSYSPPLFFFVFRRLLLARRGKKRFLPLHRYYDNARLYVNGGAIYIYQRPRVFIPRINFFFYYLLSSAESRLRLVVFSLSPFRYLRNVYTAARLSSGARDERKVNERPSVIC